MKTPIIIVVSVAVVGAAVALLVMSRSDSRADAPRDQGKSPRADRAVRAERPAIRTDGDPPRLGADTTDADKPDRRPKRSPARTHVREDGVVVTDYRTEDGSPREKPAHHRPARNALLDRAVVSRVGRAVRPHVNECLEDIPTDEFGDNARLQTDVQLQIKDGAAAVTGANMRSRGVDKAIVDVIQRCVAGKLADLSVDATDHRDVDNYTLSLPFRVGG